jgi:arginyl-tRNA synthetase
LNIVISDVYYLDYFKTIKDDAAFGFVTPSVNDKAVMVEFILLHPMSVIIF